MPERGYQIRNQYHIHFITFAVVEWVDVFTRTMYADIVVESLRFCQQQKGLKIHAWCPLAHSLHHTLNCWRKFVTCAKLILVIKN